MDWKQLQSEQALLLDKIDELRDISVEGTLEPPQLVVCGNRSSEKNSILTAISRIPFSSDHDSCSPSAIEIVLRRSPSCNAIKVSIKPGSSRTDEQAETLRSFSAGDDADISKLPALIRAAKKLCMGDSDTVSCGFSDDVLKVEFSGPGMPELIFVDLPWFYDPAIQGQGDEAINTARSLTERYIKDPRSTVLVIVSAQAGYQQQELLDIAGKYDNQRERTLGVITHLHTLKSGSEQEQKFFELAKNEKLRLHALCDWFDEREVVDNVRDEREMAFFSQGRWRHIPRERVGIDRLHCRLSNMISKQICRSLPRLIHDIQQRITDCQDKLRRLGTGRSNPQDQRGYLLHISSNFERITGQALNGIYADEFFSVLNWEDNGSDSRQLRAVVRELNEYFAEAMHLRGSRRKILDPNEKPLSESEHTEAIDRPYMHDWTPEYIQKELMEQEISERARRYRGIELPGSTNYTLVGDLFREESKPWEGIAREHMLTTWEYVRRFVHLLLRDLSDEHTSFLLMEFFIESELDNLKDALLAKLDELTSYLKRGHPLPIEKSFLMEIQMSRFNRRVSTLKAQLARGGSVQAVDILNELNKATAAMEVPEEQSAAATIVEQMQAYYSTAIVTFVNNIVTLGIENCLLAPLKTIFTGQSINNLSDEQVQALATEPSFIREERKLFSEELVKLQTSLRSFNRFNTTFQSLQGPSLFG
ncbi:hypothetical protein BO78DRAFT_443901 [Aspergillus sclerotiicarbonarius CBS 121057]|uniref:GED domain-containing protein n=1 Tax=Aspergillus sclerotiicarbonarius (strain CBS 121057 / IBT 28362) TaxID=1448318 RepID=A0A319EV79_ASPSB|nr:hypothetical protein BO78DRAFT_443901 [Aspergillus sclerotiicarbonarius CBS 121057]